MGNRNKSSERKTIQGTLDRLYSLKKSAPRFLFWVLLVMYFLCNLVISVASSSGAVIMIGERPLPLYTFAGVFSSISNVCIIIVAVYYGKQGFVAALTVLFVQLPIVIMSVVMGHNLTSLPGVFINVMTVGVVILIYRNNKKIDDYQESLRMQAVTDMLTGLPNWFATTELIEELIRKKIPFADVTIDMNGFKVINDTMGFDVGNEVLIEAAKRWKAVADGGASGTIDFISRLSGDEFCLIIREFESDEDILNSIRMYEAALKDQMDNIGYDFFLTASFGYAVFPYDCGTMDELISYSILAMQEIKRERSSEHIRKFSKDLLKKENTLEMESKIMNALENDTVFYMLQPQYDMDHKLRGFEALARMKDEDGSVISPAYFIPVAEKAGLIDRVDSAVFRKAAGFVGELIRETGSDVMLSLNVSVKHLMKKDFLVEISNLLTSSGIPAEQLELEITESIMIESVEKAMHCIDEIRKMGIKIAIDDFGTGYSSLSYLNNFPAHLLKVDKTFIDKMNTSDSSKQYVAAIITLGHVMGFNVISEGVEDSSQIETLRNIGCDYIQGYVWGRPMPHDEAGKLVRESVNKD
ncbi:MAG: bifunctional diguanylate cyclase/phosphodiesterase [Lachnospiraceae bacterium]|nr:bifunctional diguanylate cyclase/phosphodiesterase [Lachnospiraceae bacterium]